MQRVMWQEGYSPALGSRIPISSSSGFHGTHAPPRRCERPKDATDAPSLDTKFDLARQLADAVFMLHTADLMHKNLRSDTILLLRPNGVPRPPDIVQQEPTDENGSDPKTEEEDRGRSQEPRKRDEDQTSAMAVKPKKRSSSVSSLIFGSKQDLKRKT